MTDAEVPSLANGFAAKFHNNFTGEDEDCKVSLWETGDKLTVAISFPEDDGDSGESEIFYACDEVEGSIILPDSLPDEDEKAILRAGWDILKSGDRISRQVQDQERGIT